MLHFSKIVLIIKSINFSNRFFTVSYFLIFWDHCLNFFDDLTYVFEHFSRSVNPTCTILYSDDSFFLNTFWVFLFNLLIFWQEKTLKSVFVHNSLGLFILELLISFRGLWYSRLYENYWRKFGNKWWLMVINFLRYLGTSFENYSCYINFHIWILSVTKTWEYECGRHLHKLKLLMWNNFS